MAPVQQETESSIWVICQIYENGETGLLEAHVSRESADAAKKDMRGIEVEVMELQLKSIIDIDAPPKGKKSHKSSSSSSKKSKKRVKDSDDEGGDDGEGDSSDSDTSSKAKIDRNALPDLSHVKQNCMSGLTVIFRGTMERNRKVYQAAAIMYGAVVTSNVQKADYVILGTNPGEASLKAINEHGVETITEKEFVSMLETGFPKQVRKQQAAFSESDDEPPKKKQKK